jgi:catalase
MNNTVKIMTLKVRTLENMILSHVLDNGIPLSEVGTVRYGKESYSMLDKQGKKLVRWNYRIDSVVEGVNVFAKFHYEAYSYITNEYLSMEDRV